MSPVTPACEGQENVPLRQKGYLELKVIEKQIRKEKKASALPRLLQSGTQVCKGWPSAFNRKERHESSDSSGP